MSLDPLRIKHDLALIIDDCEYKFTYKSLNKQASQELNNLRKESILKFEALDEKKEQLKDLQELKTLNDEIIKDGTIIDKAKVYFEQKELIKNISSLNKELNVLEKESEDINIVIEEIHKKYFDLCIVGSGKVALQKAIEDLGISYTLINKYIDEALKKAIEKK